MARVHSAYFLLFSSGAVPPKTAQVQTVEQCLCHLSEGHSLSHSPAAINKREKCRAREYGTPLAFSWFKTLANVTV
jgi:hypothetical protein